MGRMEWTTSGFPSPRCAAPRPAEKPPRGSGKIRLVLTLTEENLSTEGRSLLQRPHPSSSEESTTWISCKKLDTAFLLLTTPFHLTYSQRSVNILKQSHWPGLPRAALGSLKTVLLRTMCSPPQSVPSALCVGAPVQ